ncbi:hypothetical protein FOB33_29455 [Klebsiella variicola]|nr:hypothetical protein [Klebsiella variicola]
MGCTAQGVKSAGQTSVTLAWKPGESGQKDLVDWFMSGDEKSYKLNIQMGQLMFSPAG